MRATPKTSSPEKAGQVSQLITFPEHKTSRRGCRVLTLADLGPQGDVLLGGTGSLLWGHLELVS